MSFILDALKKSEAERQRQAGPTLLELRITRPRRRYPLWSLLVGALLATNIAVLLVFLLRRPPAPPVNTPSAAITPATAAGAPAAPAAEPTTTAAAASPAVPVHAGPPLAATGTAGATNVPALAAQPGDNPAAPGQGSAAQASSTAADVADTVQSRNPADYEPALPQEPARAMPASPASTVDYSNLPSISQISGNVPAMQLDLLDYSELSSERYALINMQRVREGDVLPDGARVLAITPNGVAMDYRGQSFLLRPGGAAP